MKITVMGVVIVIGGILLLTFAVHILEQGTNTGGKGMTNQETKSHEWLTAKEGARYLKVKVRTLLLWVRQRKVKAFALSGTKRRVWRFRHSDLDAALLESPVLPSESPSVRPAERIDQ